MVDHGCPGVFYHIGRIREFGAKAPADGCREPALSIQIGGITLGIFTQAQGLVFPLDVEFGSRVDPADPENLGLSWPTLAAGPQAAAHDEVLRAV